MKTDWLLTNAYDMAEDLILPEATENSFTHRERSPVSLPLLLFVMELTFDTVILLYLIHAHICRRYSVFFKSGFAPYADTRDANYRAGCREKVDNWSSQQSGKIAQACMIGRDWM